MEKQIIILFGPPGAGKGTQAELLSDKLGYYHFESSKIIEATFKNESKDKVFTIEGTDYKVGDEIKKWESGNLNSPPFVVFLMSLCDQRYTATHYALFSAVASLGRIFIGPIAAVLVERVGWVDFYITSALIGIPALALLWCIHNADKAVETACVSD